MHVMQICETLCGLFKGKDNFTPLEIMISCQNPINNSDNAGAIQILFS